ncbi:hypothetical protein V8E51_007246 [Hyaloscypha variabilis]
MGFLGYQYFKETSEAPTDWEEDSEFCDEEEEYQSEDLDLFIDDHFSLVEGVLIAFRPALEQAKLALIDRLVQEFWSTFHRYQKRDFLIGRSRGMVRAPICDERPTTGILKRGHEEDNTPSCSFNVNDTRAHKRLRGTPSVLEFSEASKFACPFRKHDPRKYGVPNWGPCALTPLQTVARVKAHLYRQHRVHQCQRCKVVFDSQESLDIHVEGFKGCEARNDLPIDGVTGKIKEKLQTRKKAYPGQTEAERWGEIYQVLFPNEEVPSPYFEPIRDYQGDDIQPHDSQEVANYEEYLRRELPNFFKEALESAVNHEIQPIEERLRGQMLSLLEVAQKLAFSKYRSMIGHEAADSPSHCPEEERTSLLTSNQATTQPRIAEKFPKDTHQPPIVPCTPKSECHVSIPDSDTSTAHEALHSSTNSREPAAPPRDEDTTLGCAQPKATMKSSSKFPFSSESSTIIDSSLSPPNDGTFCNNPPETSSNESLGFTFFPDDWVSSLDNLDPSLFNWCPSWNITAPIDRI